MTRDCEDVESEEVSVLARPPIGFVVEGEGEYTTYPSFVNRILGTSNLHVPAVLGGGFGGVLRNLPEHLDNLVSTHHPYCVIATIDLIDVVNAGFCTDCVSLRQTLVQAIAQWQATRANDRRMVPLPASITPVLQIKKFETWLLSDIDALVASGLLELRPGADHAHWVNVDDEIANPTTWLGKNAVKRFNTKSPPVIKKAFARMSPATMASRSRSFDKFHRTVLSSYNSWSAAASLAAAL